MRKIAAIIAFAISIMDASQSGAEESGQTVASDRRDDSISCELYGEAAATFMRSSQDGVPLSGLIRVSGIQRNTLTYKILLMAYEQPRFSTEVYQREAIANFRNGVELACYTGWKN
ncbi:hypothetical protein [Sulfitobacter sp. R18_1]|uniref:hypothetical protein n=1 Tax=Sulfitobacter sp. R18_1 TaxID=2821104 RepID=UPI001AD95E9C|nr:hypothetical protein [Sulfitobacter sp. R18_1]MBO9429637.1 hypothetical protein [Sulfitobacter sp. R18_1]